MAQDRAIRGTPELALVPFILLAVLLAVCVVTVWDPPAGRLSWAMEVVPGLIGVAVLVATFRRFPMSPLIYWCVFIHMFVLIYGGIYTYAETPLGNWAKETFDLSRNHYDRLGHVALGFFPAFIVREILLRLTPLERGGWLFFIALSIVFAVGAFWELLEWWATLVVASDVGQAFLGSQGDVWDAQWDMFLVGIGAALMLTFFSKLHDRSLETLYCSTPR